MRERIPLTSAPLADQMRELLSYLPVAQATQLGLLASVVGRMERSWNEVVADAQEDAAIVLTDAKIVPISGWADRGVRA